MPHCNKLPLVRLTFLIFTILSVARSEDCSDILQEGYQVYTGTKPVDIEKLFEFVTVTKKFKSDNPKSQNVVSARKRCGLVSDKPIFENSADGIGKYKNICFSLKPSIEQLKMTNVPVSRYGRILLDDAMAFFGKITENEKAVISAVLLAFDMIKEPYCNWCPCMTDNDDECVFDIGFQARPLEYCRFRKTRPNGTTISIQTSSESPPPIEIPTSQPSAAAPPKPTSRPKCDGKPGTPGCIKIVELIGIVLALVSLLAGVLRYVYKFRDAKRKVTEKVSQSFRLSPKTRTEQERSSDDD